MTLLYHGTNGLWVDNILKCGIEPRGRRQTRNNWKHVPHQSNPRCVYLTDSYAPYFAFNATRGENPMCAVIEIDTDRLDINELFPDEDFLEQSSRRIDDPIPGTMSERTLYYRKKQFSYDWYIQDPETKEYSTWWETSLRYLGTCSHRGTVPHEAITRIVTWPHKKNIGLAFVWDPTITIINQRFLGDRYRVMTRKLFDGEFMTHEQLNRTDMSRQQLEEFHTNPPIPLIEGWQRIDLR